MVKAAGFDQVEQFGGAELMTRDRSQERRRDRIGVRLACALAAQNLAPLLQPDFARERLPHHLAHARDFAVERIQCEQRTAPLGRSKQRRQIAIVIGSAHQFGAIGEGVPHTAYTISINRRRSGRRRRGGFPSA